MGIRNLSGGGFGNQASARQSFMGTLWVTVGDWEEKTSSNGKQYISGKCYVSGAGESFTYFTIWPSQKNPNIIEEFKARYPVGAGAYWLVIVNQNLKDTASDDGKTIKKVYTGLQVVGFKDEFDERRDGVITGTALLNVDESRYLEKKDDKQAWLLLRVKTSSAWNGETRENEYELQAFGKTADDAYELLKGDEVENGTPLFIRGKVNGSRFVVVDVRMSSAPAAAANPEPTPVRAAAPSSAPTSKKKTSGPTPPWA